MTRISEKRDVQDRLVHYLQGQSWTFIPRFDLPAWRNHDAHGRFWWMCCASNSPHSTVGRLTTLALTGCCAAGPRSTTRPTILIVVDRIDLESHRLQNCEAFGLPARHQFQPVGVQAAPNSNYTTLRCRDAKACVPLRTVLDFGCNVAAYAAS